MLRSLATLGVLLFVSVATPTQGAPETVDISVTHLAKHAGWRVRYRVATPADHLCFVDDFESRRLKNWKVQTPGLRLVLKGEAECLESATGKRFREATLRFASGYAKPAMQYQLNQHFTDGSEWIFTGHLYAAPTRDGVQKKDARFRLHFTAAKHEHIMIGGHRRDGLADWTDQDADNRGTFVYFGNIPPVETPDVIAVVDPALPAHLRKMFETRLPELFRYFGDKIGYTLATRPEILISYDPDNPNHGNGGDVLPGAIDFDFRGPMWADDNDKVARGAFHVIAHESAHLWNGARFDSAQNDEAPWMHEGGADAFAWLAMREFGVLDAEALRSEIERALNLCIGTLAYHGGTVDAAIKARDFKPAAYSCGSVMNMLVDAQLRDKGGLFAFWRALFAEAEKSNNRYSLEQYFTTVTRLAGNQRLADLLRQLWAGPLVDPVASLTEELAHQGVAVSRGTAPAELAREYSDRAMAALMAADCGGAINYQDSPDRFRIGGLSQCRVLKDKELVVVALAGQGFKDNGAAVYSAVAERCAAGQPVEATLADGRALLLACTKPLPPLPPYLALGAWAEM